MTLSRLSPASFPIHSPVSPSVKRRRAASSLRGSCGVLLSVVVLSACSRGGNAPVGLTVDSTPPATPTPTITPVPLAARVNGIDVALAEFDAGLVQIQDAQAAMNLLNLTPEEQRRLVLDQLIDETLLAQGAQQAGFSLSDSDLQAAEQQLATALGGTDALANWQARMGYTPELFRQALARSLAAAWQRDQLAAIVPERAEQVRARRILYIDQADAESALNELKAGSYDFTSLAFTLDPATGGDVGWFPCGYLEQPAIEDAAFALQPGEFSLVTLGVDGAALVYVAARETDRPLTGDVLRAMRRKAVTDWLAAQKAQAQIERLASTAEEMPASAPAVAAPPSYKALAGDSLFSIAQKFGVTPRELLAANQGAENLAEGAVLTLPGRAGLGGEVTTLPVPAGESLDTLARLYQIPRETLIGLNRLASPAQLYTGLELAVPADRLAVAARRLASVQAGQSLFAFAVVNDLNPWLIARANQVSAARPLLAGDTVFVPSSAGDLGPLPAIIRSYNFEPLPLVQGQTVVVRVQTDQPADLTGSLDGHQLAFFADGENSYVAIQGIHVMAEPGLIAFSLQASAANGDTHPFEEMLLLAAGEYEKDPPLNVAPETIDPAVTEPELDQIEALTAAATPTKYWDGPFGFPVDVYTCSRSPFGSRRSFNGSDYIYFHGGLDYGLCENSTIFAPAPGVVVFTGLLTVRGNATIIDHGWGVYSGIWHQSQIDVKVGDQVVTGQPIGKIGDTGRVTGAHLHWEVWANGVQVNPLDWLARSFP